MAEHPGAYNNCVELLASVFGKDPGNIQGGLSGYLLTLVGKYRQDPQVLAKFAQGEGFKVKAAPISPNSLLSCTFGLDKSGEYRFQLAFRAPREGGNRNGTVSEHVMCAERGHVFISAHCQDYSHKGYESLGAIDGALPFYSNEMLGHMAQPVVVERAYLVADSNFVSMRKDPNGGPHLKIPEYYLVELPGVDLGAKCRALRHF
jgi:hypothetical protein